jgi:hypothetical protein
MTKQISKKTTFLTSDDTEKSKSMSLKKETFSNASALPKFMFGFDADVKGNLHFLDENTVIYPCGHNVVIYRTDEKSQRFIPGFEGSEGITALALSPNKNHLAVCERATKAVCTVYNVHRLLELIKEEMRIKKVNSINHKIIEKKKILCSTEYNATEFVAVDFCSNEESKKLVTLTNVNQGINFTVIVWNFDKQKCLAFQDFS